MTFHFYRYYRNWAIGFGYEQTFTGYSAIRLGLGWYCLSMTWKPKKSETV